VSRLKVRILGKLRFSEEDGVQFSISLNQLPDIPASILRDAAERPKGPGLTILTELTVGNFVVHDAHGVALYEGVKRISSEGKEGDFLLLRYADDKRLYVPMERIDLLHKYVGSRPRLDQLMEKPDKLGRHARTYWLEALPCAYEWPGLGAFPNIAEEDNLDAAKRDEWRSACYAYKQTLHADEKYREAVSEFLERQRHEPQALLGQWWVFRDKVLGVESTEPAELRDQQADVLLIKHFVLRHERNFEKVRREVEALENFTKLEGMEREPIPESVRLFVWQRDKGQCVRCGSRERLEFDHIIPISAGGSSTERNIQLLCESCNRSKGATV
jgi:hypothetical protein